MNGREVRLEIDVHHYNNFEELSVALEVTMKERNWGSESLLFFEAAWPKIFPRLHSNSEWSWTAGENFASIISLRCLPNRVRRWRRPENRLESLPVESDHLLAPTQIDVKNCSTHNVPFFSFTCVAPDLCRWMWKRWLVGGCSMGGRRRVLGGRKAFIDDSV